MYKSMSWWWKTFHPFHTTTKTDFNDLLKSAKYVIRIGFDLINKFVIQIQWYLFCMHSQPESHIKPTPIWKITFARRTFANLNGRNVFFSYYFLFASGMYL